MLVVYAVLATAGLIVLIIGYSLVNNEVTYDDQVPGINLAIVGVVLANAAGVSLLLAGHRAVAMRRVAVLGAIPALPPRNAPRPAPTTGTLLVGADGLRHFHREDCALAADRNWPALSRLQHSEAGRTPCGVCRP